MAKSNWRDVPARKKRAPGEVEAACRPREVAGGKDWVLLAWTWVWWLGPPRDRQGVWAGFGWALGKGIGRGFGQGGFGRGFGKGIEQWLWVGSWEEGSEVPLVGWWERDRKWLWVGSWETASEVLWVGVGWLVGTASALVLGGVTLGMGLMAGRGAVGSEEPVAVAALPGGAYFGGVGKFGLLRAGGSSATEACTVHFKDKRVHRTCITVYGVRAQVYIYIYRHMYIETLRHTYIYIHIHTYIHAYIYLHTCIHTCIDTYIYTNIYTYIHTYIHSYIHTYIHTYIPVYV